METYTRNYIVNPSTEQSLIRALANETLIKSRKERSHQITQATSKLAELHPHLAVHDRPSSELSTSHASRSDFRRGSMKPANDSPTQAAIQAKGQKSLPAEQIFDFQLLEREMKVLARIRRKRWLNVRFEFVRGFSTSLWYTPYVNSLKFNLYTRVYWGLLRRIFRNGLLDFPRRLGGVCRSWRRLFECEVC